MYERARSPFGGRARSVSGGPVSAVGPSARQDPGDVVGCRGTGCYPGRVGAMNGRPVRQR